jgi:chemotaxis protein methyltransferase CheR
MFAIDTDPRKLISFAELNLIEDWPMRQGFDAIFCRNVAIYFDAPTQSRLWHRFSQQTTPGGHLFIGHSERLSGPALAQMRSVGITVYAKNPSP